MKKLAYIVGVSSNCSSGELKMYDRVTLVIVSCDIASKSKVSFQSIKDVSCSQLSLLLADQIVPMNFRIEGMVVKGNGASLSRFYGNKALVVVSKVKINGISKTIGYNVSDCNGKVSRVKKEALIQYCRESGLSVPVQNMQWVGDREGEEFLREYSNDKFAVEYINAILPIAKKPVGNTAEVSGKQSFSKEQQEEIDNAIRNGVDASIIANTKLSPARMKMVWTAEKRGLPARKIADPRWETSCVALLLAEMEQGNTVDYLLNPEYNSRQLMELIMAYKSGIDLSSIADPKVSAEEMYERRIRMENNVWSDEFSSILKEH